MTNMEKFCLRWNEFETNIRDSFRKLREDRNYFDVTLATDDGHQIDAHKVILSAGSSFFSEVLGKTHHPSPFIYLKGIKISELEHVVDFLYNGEAYVAQDELNIFLEAAQELKIKGLQNKVETEINTSKSVAIKGESTRCMEDKSIIKQGDIFSTLDTFENHDAAMVREGESNTNHELDYQIEQMIENNEGLWKCKICEKTSNRQSHIKIHAESHIEGFSHTCRFCNKTATTRKALKMHLIRNHKENNHV